MGQDPCPALVPHAVKHPRAVGVEPGWESRTGGGPSGSSAQHLPGSHPPVLPGGDVGTVSRGDDPFPIRATTPPLQPRAPLKEQSVIPRGCEERGLEVQPGLIPPGGLFSTDSYQK